MGTNGRHVATSWDHTPFGRLNRQHRTGRRLTIAEALAEVATRH